MKPMTLKEFLEFLHHEGGVLQVTLLNESAALEAEKAGQVKIEEIKDDLYMNTFRIRRIVKLL